MWSSSASIASRGRGLSALARLALALTAPLAGCGWQPLYGNTDTTGPSGSAAQQMAQTHINPIADRVGQQLYNTLRDRMNPQGVPQNPTYDLIVTAAPERRPVADQPQPDGGAHRSHPLCRFQPVQARRPGRRRLPRRVAQHHLL